MLPGAPGKFWPGIRYLTLGFISVSVVHKKLSSICNLAIFIGFKIMSKRNKRVTQTRTVPALCHAHIFNYSASEMRYWLF